MLPMPPMLKEKYSIIEEYFSSRKKFQKEAYINRDFYEKEYQKALLRPKCIIVRGCSGSGKSWLTTHILSANHLQNDIINLANVRLSGSLYEYLKSQINKLQTEYSVNKTATGKAFVAEGTLETLNTYQFQHNYFMEYLNSKKDHYIILENIESITEHQNIIEEIGSLITMTDDPEVQKNNVKFIIIGTNSNIKGFFDKSPNSDTIANRIIELPEIKGFNIHECERHVTNGFHQLNINIKNHTEFNKFIYKCTNGIPQNVNDLCTQICYECLENNIDSIEDIPNNQNTLLLNAQQKWIKEAFSSNYNHIINLYRANSGANVHNNYILYILSEITKTEFDVTYLKAQISSFFPNKDSKISKAKIRAYLNLLSDDNNNNNILENKGNDYYSIRNYKTVLCIHNILYLDEDNIRIHDLSEI